MLLRLSGSLALATVGAATVYALGPYLHGFPRHRITRRAAAGSTEVALTFDDGPDIRYTPRCLDILERHGVRGTFFLVGERVRRHPDLAREIRERGHDVGNHTWSHQHHWWLGPRRSMDEVRGGSRAIVEAIGEAPRYFRPTFGIMNLSTYLASARLGERCVLWSLAARDWEAGRSAALIAETVRRRLRGGDIVLLHDGGGAEGAPEAMLGALPEIIVGAKQRGFRLVTLAEMLSGRG